MFQWFSKWRKRSKIFDSEHDHAFELSMWETKHIRIYSAQTSFEPNFFKLVVEVTKMLSECNCFQFFLKLKQRTETSSHQNILNFDVCN